MRQVLFLTLAALLLPGAIVAQDTGPMLPVAGTSAATGEYAPAVYVLDEESADQTWAQKYQDLDDPLWSLSVLDASGYSGGWQGFIRGLDILTNNPLVRTEFGFSDYLWFQGYSTTVTRRIPIIPTQPVATPGEVLIPVDPLGPFAVDRSENAARLSINPSRSLDLTVFGELWSSHSKGSRPIPFRTRVGSPDRPNRTKFETTEPVDERVTEPSLGTSLRLGSAVMSYRSSTSDYHNGVPGPFLTPDFSPDEPFASSRFQESSSKNHVFKVSVPINSQLLFTGNHITRERTHAVEGVVLPTLGSQVVPSNTRADLKTTTASLRYTPLNTFFVTARYREFDRVLTVPDIVNGGILQNQAVTRFEKEWELDGTYTGIKSSLLRGTFTREKIDRIERPVHLPVGSHVDPEEEEWEHPAQALHTRRNTFRLGGTTYLLPGFTVKMDWRTSDIDEPSFHGTAGDVTQMNGGVTYSRGDSFVAYVDFNRLKEDNNTIPPPGFLSLASIADPDTYLAVRQNQAGAQYHNDSKSLNLGVFKAIGDRLTIDSNYTIDDIDSRAFWILGIDPAFPPLVGGEGDSTGLPPELVPYNAKNKVWSTGVTYRANSRVNLRGNFLVGKTDGMTTTDSLFRLVAPVGDKPRDWQPISSRYTQVGIGIAYKWSPTQQVVLDFSRVNWNDKIENIFDGSHNTATLSFSQKF